MSYIFLHNCFDSIKILLVQIRILQKRIFSLLPRIQLFGLFPANYSKDYTRSLLKTCFIVTFYNNEKKRRNVCVCILYIYTRIYFLSLAIVKKLIFLSFLTITILNNIEFCGSLKYVLYLLKQKEIKKNY